MKKQLYILIALLGLVLATLSGCRRASHNGKLDGLWRVDTIEYVQPDGTTTVTNPTDLFYGVNLELFQIDTPGPTYTGEISYDKGGSTLGVRFTGNPGSTELLSYGVPSNPVMFDIVKLDSKHLVLKTNTTVVTCRRY